MGIMAMMLKAPAAPAGADPTSVATLVGWYRADAGTYGDSGKATPVSADGAALGAWADQSGLGHDLLQSTSGNRPALRTGRVNGLPSVLFPGGSNVNLKSGSFDWAFDGASSHGTTFIVLKQIAWAQDSVFFDSGTNSALYCELFQDGASAKVNLTSGNYTAGGQNSGLALSTWGIVAVHHGSVATLRVNASAAGASFNAGSNRPAGLCLGTATNNLAGANFEVAELILYGGTLSGADEATVRNYLNARYAIF